MKAKLISDKERSKLLPRGCKVKKHSPFDLCSGTFLDSPVGVKLEELPEVPVPISKLLALASREPMSKLDPYSLL